MHVSFSLSVGKYLPTDLVFRSCSVTYWIHNSSTDLAGQASRELLSFGIEIIHNIIPLLKFQFDCSLSVLVECSD